MAETALFKFKGSFYKREFRGQSSGPHIYDQIIFGDNLPDVMEKVINFCFEHMQREIIFTANGADREVVWSTQSRPEKADVGKYVVFQDKTVRKNYKWDDVTTTVLKNWRNKDIGILIHIHSLSLGSHADFEIAKARLLNPGERDRSGAAAIEVVNLLAKRLQEIHVHLEGEQITWKTWANHILTFNTSQQDELVYQMPPSYVSESLRLRMPDNPQLVSAHNRMNVARNVNSGYRETIEEVRRTFNLVVDMMKTLDMKITALEDRYKLGDSLLTDMEADLRPSESDFARNLAARVSDAIDIDHT